MCGKTVKIIASLLSLRSKPLNGLVSRNSLLRLWHAAQRASRLRGFNPKADSLPNRAHPSNKLQEECQRSTPQDDDR
jgi:hypothetical protein